MDEPKPTGEHVTELKEWETPQLIVEDVKTVTQGGGIFPVAGVEDVVGTYYDS